MLLTRRRDAGGVRKIIIINRSNSARARRAAYKSLHVCHVCKHPLRRAVHAASHRTVQVLRHVPQLQSPPVPCYLGLSLYKYIVLTTRAWVTLFSTSLLDFAVLGESHRPWLWSQEPPRTCVPSIASENLFTRSQIPPVRDMFFGPKWLNGCSPSA